MKSVEQSSPTPSGGDVLLYEAPDGQVRVDVRLDHDTVWLTQEQLSQLFGRERSVITKHVRNVFREGELKPSSVCAKFAHTAADGKTYQVDHYNLDLIISVGYRVKSQRGVQFRQWATKVLREHLIQGYTFNQTRLAERGLHEARQTLDLLARTLQNQSLVDETGRAVLDLIAGYADTWRLLLAYDENRLPLPSGIRPSSGVLSYDQATHPRRIDGTCPTDCRKRAVKQRTDDPIDHQSAGGVRTMNACLELSLTLT